MHLVRGLVNKVSREASELAQDYRGLAKEVRREGGGDLNFAGKLVSGAMAPVLYAVNHLAGNSYEEERGLQVARFEQPSSGKFKRNEMPVPKGKKKFIKKQVRKDVKKLVKGKPPKRGTRYSAVSAYKPAGVKFLRGGKRKQTYQIGRSKTRVFAPPVAFGFTRSLTNGFSFSAGRRPGCMKIRGTQYLGKIQAWSDSGVNTWAVLNLQDRPVNSTSSPITVFSVMPQNSYYFANPVFNMAQMFERYNMKTRLEFKTNLSTAQQGAIKFAYYDDPVAFYAQTGKTGLANAGPGTYYPLFTDAPTNADMSSMQTIRESSVWKNFVSPWSYSGPRQEMQYVPAPTYTLALNPGTTTAIDLRQTVEGIWIIGSSGLVGGTPNTMTPLGECWIRYELELCDITSHAPTNNPSLREVKRPSDARTTDRLEQLELKLAQMDLKKNDTPTVQTSKEYALLYETALAKELKEDREDSPQTEKKKKKKKQTASDSE